MKALRKKKLHVKICFRNNEMKNYTTVLAIYDGVATQKRDNRKTPPPPQECFSIFWGAKTNFCSRLIVFQLRKKICILNLFIFIW